MAAVLLGTLEAVHLGIAGSDDLDLTGRLLSALYVLSPFTMAGVAIATTAAALAAIWARARRANSNGARSVSLAADATAGILAVGIFTGGMFVASRLVLEHSHNRAVGGLALGLLTPAAAVAAFYAWAMLRAQFTALEGRFGPRSSQVIGGAILAFCLSLFITTVLRNEGLAQQVGGWSVAFFVGYPVLTVLLALGLHRWGSAAALARKSARRAVLVVGLFSVIGAIDLVVNMDARAEVKRALLHNTLAFEGLVASSQPLFDADRDGYAGLLGGGDCDDRDARIHPGAREQPGNGVDEDCFGGDALVLPELEIAPASEAQVDVANAPRPGVMTRLVPSPNIVLITVDTLRADRMGYMGYGRPTTPQIDRLVADGLRFRWAFAQGAQTKVSMPSMFTGRYYSEVKRTPEVWPRLHDSNVTLAERLTDAGYKTAGVVSHRFFLRSYGMHQGFETWDLSVVKKWGRRLPHVVSGHRVTDRAIEWLQKYDAGDDARPYFLWLHYFDPHHFYQDHAGADFGREADDLYDEEILFTDQQVGRLVAWLEAAGHLEQTYLMLNSDHGEGFGDHGYTYHGQHLFNDQVHVPLALVGPGLPSKDIETPVAMIDVLPTLVQLAGLPVPLDSQGVSLLPYGDDSPPPRGPIFTEMLQDKTHPQNRWAVLDWPWKLHYGARFNEYLLFDLSTDPTEKTDLSETRVAEFERMQALLRRWLGEVLKPEQPHW